MNIKLITKALHTLSLLSDEDVDIALKLRALNEDERELLITVLEPMKPTGKKSSKKQPSKSKRASGLGDAIKGNLQRREPTVGGFADDADMTRCMATDEDGPCGYPPDHNIHHLNTNPDYHEFVLAATEQSAAVGG